MRHSRLTQSYLSPFPSLEVRETEIGRSVKPWTCQTIAQMSIPKADVLVEKSPVKARRLGIVRRSHSVADAHRVTIHRNVTRRMQVARERGDQNLLRALEAELREMISI
ncbi:hypothetical protein Q2T42_14240 [Leptolyngbya boryana CZ1]|jgi:hypothetical protein|uniref:Uncharacterized protein n=2 Tax=Leptolyngbya boryana TaxID=1184 RepID=A0A1Z4JBA0_LEPBY|nr:MULTISPECIES: hypothetical protein [Leptolyngbya]BAY53727.1 hypothetical protein NIES2135_05380 [Leptolyngbya boryana NIES-2135]MBD1858170.1 hypothetical protein [Leptolyngbya sp. FACHB-1624]MBD2367831.1 hypothetical protein [Leptolyngbya sp. FACHB-161]MBD2374321.1 hypothetical protein [Leptolyngbya sp. FACHB-238]MBD2398543.1 hypothetical protein [Leptolyngbya sp. FACHB-239]